MGGFLCNIFTVIKLSPVLLENIKQFTMFAINQSLSFVAFLTHIYIYKPAKNRRIYATAFFLLSICISSLQ